MLELWQEMAGRFAAVDSERSFHVACKLAGLGLRELIETGQLIDEVSRQLLEASYSPNPKLADFALRAAWYDFADRVVRDASVLELNAAGDGTYIGQSDFAHDWPTVKENYRTVCTITARHIKRSEAEPPEASTFLTTTELRYRFVNGKGELISRRHLQNTALPLLADHEKRQVGKKGVGKKGIWMLELEATKRVMATTTWRYQEPE